MKCVQRKFSKKSYKFLLLFYFVFAQASYAQIYQWRDEDGKLHFSDQAPGKSNHNRVELKEINSSKPVMFDKRGIQQQKKEIEERKRKKQEALERRRQKAAQLAKVCSEKREEYLSMPNGEGGAIQYRRHQKTVTQKEQKAIAESFRRSANDIGCNIEKRKRR